jgi:hypothetical protein
MSQVLLPNGHKRSSRASVPVPVPNALIAQSVAVGAQLECPTGKERRPTTGGR